jgi:hypothetical protein
MTVAMVAPFGAPSRNLLGAAPLQVPASGLGSWGGIRGGQGSISAVWLIGCCG